jgi:A/G-specific adenine glycosylase
VNELPHPGDFASRLLRWHVSHGRHDLPWQREPSPYRVWLSEVMLQQTQVGTVLGYFERFTQTFADVKALAEAPLDEVLHLWSGLGYYSRARNLHKTAQIVASEYGGEFPDQLDALIALPGIGRSTAGAIIALAGNRRAAILDGNVKRVLARHYAIEGWPGTTSVLKQLWATAESVLPSDDYRNFTQAEMDLGATVCTRRNPNCEACPLRSDCAARAQGRIDEFPGRRPRRQVPTRSACFLIVSDRNRSILLQRRPPNGIWGGLWCFPEIANEATLPQTMAELGLRNYVMSGKMAPIPHTFTHFKLLMEPLCIEVGEQVTVVRETDAVCWYNSSEAPQLGLPMPVSRLLNALAAQR